VIANLSRQLLIKQWSALSLDDDIVQRQDRTCNNARGSAMSTLVDDARRDKTCRDDIQRWHGTTTYRCTMTYDDAGQCTMTKCRPTVTSRDDEQQWTTTTTNNCSRKLLL